MRFGKNQVRDARNIIEFKRAYWEKKMQTKFDKDGRALIGTLSSFDENDFINIVRCNISKEFSNCFTKGLEELNIVPFPLENLTYDDYKRKRITVTTTKGRTQEKNIAAFLQKAQDVWEREQLLYRPFRNHMRDVRQLIDENGREQEMSKLSEIEKKMIRGNTYIAYDKLLREFQERPMYISINPLDKLYAAGTTDNGQQDTLTRFYSCWGNTFEKIGDESYKIHNVGMYSNPKAQIILGSHISSGMILVPNGRSHTIDGMTFYGMAQRSHIWLYDAGLFIENIYPEKYNRKRLEEISSIISAKTKVIENIPHWTKVTIDKVDTGFNREEWWNILNKSVNSGKKLYLDRSAIDERDGEVYITPYFRANRPNGGTMWKES